jgi:hypothetical protein
MTQREMEAKEVFEGLARLKARKRPWIWAEDAGDRNTVRIWWRALLQERPELKKFDE